MYDHTDAIRARAVDVRQTRTYVLGKNGGIEVHETFIEKPSMAPANITPD